MRSRVIEKFFHAGAHQYHDAKNAQYRPKGHKDATDPGHDQAKQIMSFVHEEIS
jgi:hypothetical protein